MSSTEVAWLGKNPWCFMLSGVIDMNIDKINNLRNINEFGYYLTGTISPNPARIYDLWFDDTLYKKSLYPNDYGMLSYGYSVHKIICLEKSNSCFTPYGYKFDGKKTDEVRIIYEQYRSTGVEWIVKSPWMSNLGGYAEIGLGIRNVNSDELQAGGTLSNGLNKSYSMLGNDWNVYPSAGVNNWAGFSVRKNS